MIEPTITDLEEIAQTDTRGAWLMTYADLVTLILVFFVLLFSLSKMETGNIVDALKSCLEESVEAEFTEGSIVLRVEGNVFFKSGSSDLLPEASHILSDIIQIIQNNPHYDVDIQGHTDDRPISTPKFASNWELSAIRATTVLRYLIENGISEERLTATGFADLRPVASNYTPEGRRKNRRVEFVLKEN